MKVNFQFSNVCGTVYRQGNIIFTSDGNSLLSPVGNRVSVFDLVKCVSLHSLQHTNLTSARASNKSHTFAFENRKNVATIALNPNGTVLISIDDGAPYASLLEGKYQQRALQTVAQF
jgi:periodic tryptophan protein 2